MGDTRTDFDHAIPMTDDTATQQEADLAGSTTTDGGNGTGNTSDAAQSGPDTGTSATGQGRIADAKQAVVDGAGKLGQQATDRARLFAEDGKARAGGALDQLSQMLTDAAEQVDGKLGGDYGQYARQAATTVQGFSEQIKGKDIDELVEDVRGLVRKSPAVAIGAAAAVGFVVARLVQAGLDDRKADA